VLGGTVVIFLHHTHVLVSLSLNLTFWK